MNSIKLWNGVDTIFINSGNSKTSDPQRLLLNLLDKINLKRSDIFVALSNLNINYTCKKIKKSYKNNKFKISAPKWKEEFELPDGSYYDILDCFKYIFKKHERGTSNSSIIIYVNKIENRIMFKFKIGCYLELLIPETIKWLGSTRSKKTEVKSDENFPHLELNEAVLIHCNNDYKQNSRALYAFFLKSFGQLLNNSLTNFMFLKNF